MPLRNINIKAKRLKQALEISLVAAGQHPARGDGELFRPGFHARRRVIFGVRAEGDYDHIFPQTRGRAASLREQGFLCDGSHGISRLTGGVYCVD
jgi:hypothetical protein